MGSCMSTLSELTEPPFQTPRVTLDRCEVGAMSLLQGMNITLVLVVRNPNSKKLMMDVVSYKLAKNSDGTVLADATVIKRELLQPDSSKTVSIPIKVGFIGMGKSAKSMLVSGATKIDITGTVTFEAAPATGDKEIDVNFRGNWEIEMG